MELFREVLKTPTSLLAFGILLWRPACRIGNDWPDSGASIRNMYFVHLLCRMLVDKLYIILYNLRKNM